MISYAVFGPALFLGPTRPTAPGLALAGACYLSVFFFFKLAFFSFFAAVGEASSAPEGTASSAPGEGTTAELHIEGTSCGLALTGGASHEAACPFFARDLERQLEVTFFFAAFTFLSPPSTSLFAAAGASVA